MPPLKVTESSDDIFFGAAASAGGIRADVAIRAAKLAAIAFVTILPFIAISCSPFVLLWINTHLEGEIVANETPPKYGFTID